MHAAAAAIAAISKMQRENFRAQNRRQKFSKNKKQSVIEKC